MYLLIKMLDSISSNKIDISYGSKGTSKINLNSYFKNEKSYLDIALTDFHTDGIDARGNGDLDPIDRKTLGINLGTELTEETSVLPKLFLKLMQIFNTMISMVIQFYLIII